MDVMVEICMSQSGYTCCSFTHDRECLYVKDEHMSQTLMVACNGYDMNVV